MQNKLILDFPLNLLLKRIPLLEICDLHIQTFFFNKKKLNNRTYSTQLLSES